MASTVETRLNDMGITLPDAPGPAANYVPFVQTGNLLMISGQGPIGASGVSITGRLGDGLEIEDGTRAAQMAGLNIIAQIKAALNGDFDRLVQIVRLNGFVNSTPEFTHHPAVINGASELMHDVFEARGVHSRIAVGVASLPMNWAVEIDAVVEVAE